jgi:hypothetical protein
MIGSHEALFNASQGRMAPRVVAPPKTPLEPYKGSNWLASDLATAQSGLSSTPTGTYGRIVSSPATGGLTAKGKYGGFFSAADEQSAIEGGALNLRENVAPTLMAKAEAFYNKLDPMYGEASKGPSRFFMKPGMSQMPGVDPNRTNVTQGGYIDKIVNPSRRYANQLNDWYATQAKPAQEYNATAMQIQSTPLSQLAAQIATSAYGMNYDLATSKFSGLDAKYFKEQEDAAAMAETQKAAAAFAASSKENAALNIPASGWKAYKATEAENAKTAAKIPGEYQRLVQDATQLKASALESATSQTSEQIYSSLNKEFTFKNPDDNTEIVSNGAGAIAKMNTYIDAGDTKAANALMTNIAGSTSEGQQQLVRILTAMFKLRVTNTGTQTQANSFYSTR